MEQDRITTVRYAIELWKFASREELPERFHGPLGELGWANFMQWFQRNYTYCASCYTDLLYKDVGTLWDAPTINDYTDETS